MNGPLPLGLPPLPAESLASYVDRLAAMYDVPLGVMLRRVGLYDGSKASLAGYGIVLAPERLIDLSKVTSLQPGTLEGMLLSRYVGGAIPTIIDSTEPRGAIRRLSSHWVYLHSSHFCPHCIRDSGGTWRLPWRLAWSFACVNHRSLLIDRCPGCHHRPLSGGPRSLSPNFLERVPSPGSCSNRQRIDPDGQRPSRRPCGCDLTAVRPLGLSSWPAILAAQELINQRLPSVNAETSGWFLDLRAVATLLLGYAEPEDFGPLPARLGRAIREEVGRRLEVREQQARERDQGRRARRVRTYQTVPKSSPLVAVVVPTAVQLLAAESAEAMAENLARLAERMREHGESPAQVPRAYKVSDLLAAALNIAAARTGSFSMRVGLHPGMAREQLGHRVAFGPQHVPQLLWKHEFDREFAGLFRGFPETQARAFCSLCLVKLLDRRSWEQAAAVLDLPGAHQALVYRCQQWLAARNGEEAFRSRLHQLAIDVAAGHQLIDYAARRRAFAELREVPDSLWDVICRRLGIRRTRSGGRRKYGAAWLWAEVTSGDPRRSPALASASPVVLDGWRRFCARDLVRMEPELATAARALLSSPLNARFNRTHRSG